MFLSHHKRSTRRRYGASVLLALVSVVSGVTAHWLPLDCAKFAPGGPCNCTVHDRTPNNQSRNQVWITCSNVTSLEELGGILAPARHHRVDKFQLGVSTLGHLPSNLFLDVRVSEVHMWDTPLASFVQGGQRRRPARTAGHPALVGLAPVCAQQLAALPQDGSLASSGDAGPVLQPADHSAWLVVQGATQWQPALPAAQGQSHQPHRERRLRHALPPLPVGPIAKQHCDHRALHAAGYAHVPGPQRQPAERAVSAAVRQNDEPASGVPERKPAHHSRQGRLGSRVEQPQARRRDAWQPGGVRPAAVLAGTAGAPRVPQQGLPAIARRLPAAGRAVQRAADHGRPPPGARGLRLARLRYGLRLCSAPSW
ncbi:hypothetical protein MTO96_048664 [Rhipicephalus appendiculatus]